MTTAAIKASIHKWANTSNTEDRKQLSAWMQRASYDELEDMMDFYEEYMGSQPAAAPFSEHLHQSIEKRLDAWEKTAAPINNQVLSMHFWKVAAAAIFLLGVAWFLLKPIQSSQEQSIALIEPGSKNDVPAGTDRAFLQLSDGRTIELNGQHASELSNETAARLDTANAIIAFSANISAIDTTTYQVSTPKGGKFQLLLPDNTKVWLNAESSIRFPKVFKQTERRVQITGEAYFEVAENKSAPFNVEVNELEVKVLGTHFNVNAFPEEDAVTTTLLEGAVQLKSNHNTAILKPGFQAVLANNQLQVAAANTGNAVAWKNGLFAFEKSPVKKIMQQFERWYEVEVHYEGEVPAQYFTGEFSRSFTLAQSLRILAYSGLRFKIEEKKIIVL